MNNYRGLRQRSGVPYKVDGMIWAGMMTGCIKAILLGRKGDMLTAWRVGCKEGQRA